MNPKPFLKWAGGKTQLLPILSEHIPKDFDTYYEPFVGAGALLFHLLPKKAVISDINEELINCYKAITFMHDKFAEKIDSFPVTQEFFHELRAADRAENWQKCNYVWRAARIIYLNKTCYNGLYRVNKKGQVNSPWGYYDNPTIYELDNFQAVSKYLDSDTITMIAMDFNESLKLPQPGDFVYLDPPYDILNDTSSFTGYSAGCFHKEHHVMLKKWLDVLTQRNVKVLQSNADTPFIRSLYADYEIIEVQAKRSINSKGDKRGNVNELLIKNY